MATYPRQRIDKIHNEERALWALLAFVAVIIFALAGYAAYENYHNVNGSHFYDNMGATVNNTAAPVVTDNQ